MTISVAKKERLARKLRHEEGRTLQQVADALGCSVSYAFKLSGGKLPEGEPAAREGAGNRQRRNLHWEDRAIEVLEAGLPTKDVAKLVKRSRVTVYNMLKRRGRTDLYHPRETEEVAGADA